MATVPATGNGRASKESLDTRELLKTLTAVKKGDFSMRLPVEQTGTVGKIYDTLNDIFDLIEGGTKEFVRIGIVVGKEGRMTERATLPGAQGAWLDGIVLIPSIRLIKSRPSGSRSLHRPCSATCSLFQVSRPKK